MVQWVILSLGIIMKMRDLAPLILLKMSFSMIPHFTIIWKVIIIITKLTSKSMKIYKQWTPLCRSSLVLVAISTLLPMWSMICSKKIIWKIPSKIQKEMTTSWPATLIKVVYIRVLGLSVRPLRPMDSTNSQSWKSRKRKFCEIA